MRREIAATAATMALVLAILTAPAAAGAEEVRVTISYSLSVMAESESAEDVVEAQGKARRAMYTMMAKECAAMEETIAQNCKLTTFRIQTEKRYRRRQQSAKQVSVNGSGTYAIELK